MNEQMLFRYIRWWWWLVVSYLKMSYLCACFLQLFIIPSPRLLGRWTRDCRPHFFIPPWRNSSMTTHLHLVGHNIYIPALSCNSTLWHFSCSSMLFPSTWLHWRLPVCFCAWLHLDLDLLFHLYLPFFIYESVYKTSLECYVLPYHRTLLTYITCYAPALHVWGFILQAFDFSFQLFENLTFEIQGQGHAWGQNAKLQSASNVLSTHIPFGSMSIDPPIPGI